MPRFQGIITALITPLNENGDLCVECLRQMIEFQFEKGVDGLFLTGTWGEGVILSERVRARIYEKAIEFAPSRRGLIIPHIGAPDLEVAVSLARRARDLGYDTVSAVGPIYNIPTKRGVIEYYARIARADVNIIVYNNTGRQGYNITPDDFEALLNEVPSITGIKEEPSHDISQLLEYVQRFGDRVSVIGADDHFVFYTFSIGAPAHIPGISNAFPEFYTALYRYIRQGNYREASELQWIISRIKKIAGRYGVETYEVVREMIRLRGVDSGYPPLQLREGLTEAQKQDLRKTIQPYIDLAEKTKI